MTRQTRSAWTRGASGRRWPPAAGTLLCFAALASGCTIAPVRPPAVAVQVPATSAAGERVAAEATRFVGTPYRFGGASPGGFDCSGLVWYVHRELGLEVPRTAADQRAAAKPVPRDALRAGDLVFFYTPQDHVGIYVGDGTFVPAPATGRTGERARLDSPFFLLSYAGAGRFAP